MSDQTQPILSFIGQSFLRPKETAEALNAMRFNRGILWSLMLLVVVLSVIAMSLTLLAFPQDVDNPFGMWSPFGLMVILGGILVMFVFAIYFSGQMLGGTGRFPGTLLMLCWWQAMTIVVQIAQIAAVLVAPLLGGLVSIAGFGWMVAALVIAVDVLHGFNNLFKALATIFIAFLGPVVGLSFILTLIGVTLQGAAL